VLAPWATRRRQDLLELLDRLNPNIAELSTAIDQEGKKRPEVVRLMTHPGVGPLTGLAFALIIEPVERFRCGKQIGSYLGLIPCEDSSAGKQRLGHISSQFGTTRTGDGSSYIWRCGEDARSRR
jgi:transposase